MITIADVQDALKKDDLDFTDETVGRVLAAEHAHQRSVLDIPSPRPANVDEALVARVVHNLKNTGGDPVSRIGYQGIRVGRLEAPYRIRATTVPADEPTTTTPDAAPAPEKRPAKKAATHQEES